MVSESSSYKCINERKHQLISVDPVEVMAGHVGSLRMGIRVRIGVKVRVRVDLGLKFRLKIKVRS